MNKRVLFALWGVLFLLCAGLGFVPAGVWGTLAALAFFLPPAALLYLHREERVLKLIRSLSALSLGLTVLLLVLNFAAAFGSEALGSIVHIVLTIVSAPMLCGGNWAMSLFLWACLLLTSRKLLRQ